MANAKKNANVPVKEQTTADCAAEAQPIEATARPMVNTLDVHGNCGNCGNPYVAKYGEGKWNCICGARG